MDIKSELKKARKWYLSEGTEDIEKGRLLIDNLISEIEKEYPQIAVRLVLQGKPDFLTTINGITKNKNEDLFYLRGWGRYQVPSIGISPKDFSLSFNGYSNLTNLEVLEVNIKRCINSVEFQEKLNSLLLD